MLDLAIFRKRRIARRQAPQPQTSRFDLDRVHHMRLYMRLGSCNVDCWTAWLYLRIGSSRDSFTKSILIICS